MVAKNAAQVVTQERLKALKLGETASDSVRGRGNGSVLFERKPSGAITATYRYSHNHKRVKHQIGHFKQTSRDAGLTLAEIRAKAQEFAELAKVQGNIAEHEKAQELEAERESAERQRLAVLEKAKGSFADLFSDYMADRKGKIADRTLAEMQRIFEQDLKAAHPAILALKASDVTKEHIKLILSSIHERGAEVLAERVRAYLAAAFRYGLDVENTVGRASSAIYGLNLNPAAIVKVKHESRPVQRALSDAELKQFWFTIDKASRVGARVAALLRFVIATGGQRVANILEVTKDAYDLEGRQLKLVHRKGRGGSVLARVHYVPLTDRAISLVQPYIHSKARPWTTQDDGRPIALASLKNAINRWLASEYAVIDGKRIEHFTARDLRRTCTQVMQRYGVDDRLSDLLQAHGVGGVVNAHYRNNPLASLSEKWRAIKAFDTALDSILDKHIV